MSRLEPEALRRLAAEIKSVEGELDAIVNEASEAMLATSFAAVPERFRLRSFGSLLHDFYTAVEDIFELVSQDLDGGVPSGPAWHRRLLNSMSVPVEDVRPGWISKETAEWLNEYLSFRHAFRNVYGHRLQWNRMKPLLEQLPDRYSLLKREISAFVRYLLDAADRLELTESAQGEEN